MFLLPCILLVDDNPTVNFLNKDLLSRLRVAERLLVAQDGQEALTLLQCGTSPEPECPALILLDMQMPGMDGAEFLEAYQQLPLALRQRIVVLMLTTSLSLNDQQRVERFPVHGFISKPLDEAKVRDILRQHFGKELPAARASAPSWA